MKRSIPVLIAGLFLLALAIAQTDVVGRWTGGLQIDETKIPKPRNDEEKKQMEQGLAMVRKIRFNLTLNADKTYLGVSTGIPQGDARTEGSWALSGTTLTLTPKKRNGKPVTKDDGTPRRYTLSKDGKSLSMAMPGGQGVTMVLRRRS